MKMRPLLPLVAVALFAGCYPDASKLQASDASVSSDASFLDAADADAPLASQDAPAEAADAPLGSPDASVEAADAPMDNGDAGSDLISQGQDSGPDGFPVPAGLTDLSPAMDRCKFLASSYCARFQQCSPSWFQATNLDFADCEQGVTAKCLLTAELPGSTHPTVACAQGYADHSCALLSAGKQPKACYSPGDAIEGQACSDEHQCQGRRCLFDGTSSCGKCTRRATMFEACKSNEDCYRDGFCFKNACIDASATSCSSAPCKPGLRCDANKQCIPLSTEGGPCTTGTDCDIYNGVTCDLEVSKCVKYSADPHTCTQNSDRSFVFCAGGMFCRNAAACLPNAKVGEACDDNKGPYCEYPATCDSSTLKCRVVAPDPTCGPPPPLSGPPTNAAAEISGDIIGFPTQDNEALRRKLKVTVLPPVPADLNVGEVWALSMPAGANVYLPIPVTNQGQDIICAIAVETISLRDAVGTELESAFNQELMGSMQKVSTIWTRSCLRPGETGYVLSSVASSSNIFASAAAIQITFMQTRAYGAENVVRVTPMSYTTSAPGTSAPILVTVKNTGTLYATLDTGSHFLVLDDTGPVGFGNLLAPSPAVTLAPGDIATLRTPDLGGLRFGHGTRVRVFIALKQPTH